MEERDTLPVQDVPIERSMKIVIKSIENIVSFSIRIIQRHVVITRKLAFMRQTVKEKTGISFIVMHNDVVLGESIPLIIHPTFEESPQIYDVNFAVELSFIVNDRNSMDPIVSTPILSKGLQLTRCI